MDTFSLQKILEGSLFCTIRSNQVIVPFAQWFILPYLALLSPVSLIYEWKFQGLVLRYANPLVFLLQNWVGILSSLAHYSHIHLYLEVCGYFVLLAELDFRFCARHLDCLNSQMKQLKNYQMNKGRRKK